MQVFQTFVQSRSPCSEESWQLLQACLTEMSFRKNDCLLREGRVCREIYFITQGCCRAVYHKDGRDVHTAFYFESEFATNLQSLQSGNPSEYRLVACEPLQVIRLDKEQLLAAYRQSHELEHLGRTVLTTILTRAEETANTFRLLSPRQRYERLLQQQPQVLQRVSLTRIASYLGISRETLSRFRARR